MQGAAPPPDKFFAGMNQTEKVAYHWLKKNKFTEIVFDHGGTPDFHTAQGTFEVKRLYGSSTITFTRNQRQRCVDAEAKVLVFVDGEAEPKVILEPHELTDGLGMKPGTNVLKRGILIHIMDEGGQDVQVRIRGRPELGVAFDKWVSKYQEEVNRKVSQEEAMTALLGKVGIVVPATSRRTADVAVI